MAVALSGPALLLRTCARRLAPLGATPSRRLDDGDPSGGGLVLDWAAGPGTAGPDLDVELSWFGPATMGGRPGSEAVVQAMSGLMAVHGRDAGGPRRIGLEVASVAAGILAGQSVLAALVGRSRGVPVARIEGSGLQAALLLVSHRIAAATAGSEWVPAPPASAPGPPFASAEGDLFEIETLDPSAWRGFWERLGTTDDLEWAWRLFRPRYFRGTCTLPPALHEATRAHPLAEIVAAAEACRVSLSPVRSYEDVLESPGRWEGHPVVQALDGASAAPGPPQAPPTSGSLPLAGLRVVEATSRLQGPLAGLLLQMLGAHVVRVEPPGGDPSRAVPPLAGEEGSFYLTFNRGKQPVELDLGRPQGRADLAELAAGADVFLQNWRPGKAAEWGLAADDLAAANPRLVYARASGWGDLPGVAHLVGTDYLVQAYAGVGAGIHPDGRPPLPSRALLTDYMGALATCEAVLWGLCLLERTGRGQRVDASLLAGAMALQAHVLEALVTGREKGRRGGRPVWTLLDHPLETADGVLVVSVEDDDGLHRLCRACGVDVDQPPAVQALVAERIARGTTADWEERLTEATLPCSAACTDLAALPADARLSGCFEPLAGTAWVPTAPWRLSGADSQAPAP